jgi:hypothetical protein
MILIRDYELGLSKNQSGYCQSSYVNKYPKVDPGLGREDMVHNNTTEDYITS